MADYFEARQVRVDDNFPQTCVIPDHLRDILSKTDKQVKILDFGCGFGGLLFALQKSGFKHIIGCDINENALAYLQSKNIQQIHANDLYQNTNEKYDIIFMSHVLEHLPKDQMIPELNKMRQHLLKDTGMLIVSVPNAQAYTGCYWAYEDFTHNFLFTTGSLLYVLKMAGFTTINFIDLDCTDGKQWYKKIFRKVFIKFFRLNNLFWSKVTGCVYHDHSPITFSYEIKAIATK